MMTDPSHAKFTTLHSPSIMQIANLPKAHLIRYSKPHFGHINNFGSITMSKNNPFFLQLFLKFVILNLIKFLILISFEFRALIKVESFYLI